MENIHQQTLSNIVISYHPAAVVFEKFNLDFCCKGKRSLEEACKEKDISLSLVTDELKTLFNNQMPQQDFSGMSPSALIGFILLQHHFYVRQNAPLIINHLTKMASRHGGGYPYMLDVLDIFLRLSEELELHMKKEENVLFPRIKDIEGLQEGKNNAGITKEYISMPVRMMEHEHDDAGVLMALIRQLTNDYSAPVDACTTFRIVMDELKSFEMDLHRHVHIENNILFPMANTLAEKLISHASLN